MRRSLMTRAYSNLTSDLYVRHFLFAMLFPLTMAVALWDTAISTITLSVWLMVSVNTLIYPYARYSFAMTVRYLMGKNACPKNFLVRFSLKVATVLFCWTFAVFLAPLGLLVYYAEFVRYPPTP